MATPARGRKRVEEPGEAPEQTGLLSLPLIGTALTPLTLAITGMLYLTGWTERNKLLKTFGVSASIVPEPIQNTLARGYTPLLMGIVVSVAVLTVLVFVMKRTLRRWEHRLGQSVVFPFGASAGAQLVGSARVRSIFASLSACGILFALLISHVSGMVSARIKALDARQIIARNNCEDCFRYRVHGQHLHGKILAQNDERTILLMSDGIRLLRTGEISAVLTPRSHARR